MQRIFRTAGAVFFKLRARRQSTDAAKSGRAAAAERRYSTMGRKAVAGIIGAAALALWFAGSVAAADELRPVRGPLDRYNIDLSQSSVSGLSAGGFMAGQFFVAYSDIVAGAGIFAGGPYGCARGDIIKALDDCMACPSLLTFAVMNDLVQKARALARAGRIDPPENLQNRKVYLFSGLADKTVSPGVVDRAYDWYLKAGVPRAALHYKKSVPAGHALPTVAYGNVCDDVDRPPWMSACRYDGAGEMLRHIYGPLKPARKATGRLVEFAQKDFADVASATPGELAARAGLHEFGYAYVPQSCAQGAVCRIHVVFHGCRQIVDADPEGKDLEKGGVPFGLQMVLHAGYNEWADANHFIVLYPQAQKSAANPNGCFDWWGYLGGGPDAYLTKDAPQMKAVRAMMRAASGK